MVEWLFISQTVQRGCMTAVPASKTEPPEAQPCLVDEKVNKWSDLEIYKQKIYIDVPYQNFLLDFLNTQFMVLFS